MIEDKDTLAETLPEFVQEIVVLEEPEPPNLPDFAGGLPPIEYPEVDMNQEVTK